MQLKLAAAIFGVDPAQLGNFDLSTARSLLFNPSSQLQELQSTLQSISNRNADATVVRETAVEIFQKIAQKLATRGGVEVTQLFPVLPSILRATRSTDSTARTAQQQKQQPRAPPQNKNSRSDDGPGSGDGNNGSVDSSTTKKSTQYSSTAMRLTADVRGRSRSQERSSKGAAISSVNKNNISRSVSSAASMQAAVGNGEFESVQSQGLNQRKVLETGDSERSGEVPAPVVEIVADRDGDVARRTDGIRLIQL